MAYNPYYPNGWKNNEEGETPITAAALQNMEDGLVALDEQVSDLNSNPALYWTSLDRTVSHPTGSNYWTMGTFPSKSGYTRQAMPRSLTAGIVVTGWYLDGNNLILRTHNLTSSTQSCSLNVTLIYLRDALRA